MIYAIKNDNGKYLARMGCKGHYTADIENAMEFHSIPDNLAQDEHIIKMKRHDIILNNILMKEVIEAIQHLRVCRLCAHGVECINYDELINKLQKEIEEN
jgi:hypothetical protein